ncbi:MAG: RIP metalloprotease RseP [Bacteroidales bacterium]|nr:RIP metalloprotease RseP [Bacteroidales bacterium]
METFLIRAVQLILSLSILVIVHEFGHFIFARIFKVRVEKFYLFFNPWFTLFKFKPKNSDTEYGIGWLPLGGYCKISGMIDESMDKEQMAQPPKPYEFRSKPAFQRFMIMIGGVLFNFILALIIYAAILFTWGDSYLPMKNASMGMDFSETAHQMGFQDGDILLSADNIELDRYGENTIRAIAAAKEVRVLRNGKEVAIPVPSDFMQQLMGQKKGFAAFRYPMVVEKTLKNSPAEQAGLKRGDSIVAINGMATPVIYEAMEQLADNKGKSVMVSFYRDGALQEMSIETDTLGKIGIQTRALTDIYPLKTERYNFFESIPAGVKKGVNTLKGYISDFQYVFTKEGASSLGGFGTIGSIFPATFHAETFWEMTAFLSIILAFMNILPIPALDGGHLLFLLYEIVTRRKPSEKFMEYAQMVGMFILFALLIYANGNDLFRFLFK